MTPSLLRVVVVRRYVVRRVKGGIISCTTLREKSRAARIRRGVHPACVCDCVSSCMDALNWCRSGRWDDPEPSGCGSKISYAFFLSYTMIVSYVMLNVFIAVILEQFGEVVGGKVCHRRVCLLRGFISTAATELSRQLPSCCDCPMPAGRHVAVDG